MPALNVVANAKGEQLVLVNNKWEPVTQTAVNSEGNKAYLVGNEWLVNEPEAPASAPPPEMSLGQAVGLTGRGTSPYMSAAIAGGLAAAPTGVGAPLGAAVGVGALGLTDLSTSLYNMAGNYMGWPRVKTGSERVADMYGFPQPQTPGQNMYVNALQAATGAGMQASASRAAAAALPSGSTGQRVFTELARQPATQVAAATTASTVEDYAREKGVDNPVLLAALGMAGGVLGGGAFGAAERRVRNLRAPNPTLDSVRDAAKAKYAEVDNAGVIFDAQSYENFINTVEQNLTNAGFNPNAHTPITTWVNRLERSRGTSGTLAELDAFRSQLKKSLGKSQDANIRQLLDEFTDTIDNYVGNAGPADIFTGNLPQAQQAITDARRMWTQLSKGEAIEDLLTRASYREGNQSAAIRAQFRQLADNPRRMRQFSTIEQDFIRDVARGRSFNRALEFFGDKAMNVGGLMAVGGPAAGAVNFLPGIDATTGLMLGGGLMGTGLGMKVLSTGLTRGQARGVQQMGLSGRPRSASPRNALVSQSLQNAINRSTMDPALAAALGFTQE